MEESTMASWLELRQTISSKYAKFLEQHGPCYKALNWGSENSQHLRFKILAEIDNLENATILDVGCGLGEMVEYLDTQLNNFSYDGIDITPEMIAVAQKTYAKAHFQHCDILTDSLTKTYDYVFASGIFTYLGDNPQSKFYAIIEKMFNLANKGIAFNVLSGLITTHTEEEFNAKPEEVLAFALSLSPKAVLRHDYLPHDFTVYIYK